MSDVATPFGISDAPIPSAALIAHLEVLLEQARRGEIIGVVWGAVRPNRFITFGSMAGTGDCNLLVAAATWAQRDLMDAIDRNAL